MKDNFSRQSDKYAKYRPHYPDELFQFLNQQVANKHAAWDCGTGNGQIAGRLSETFEEVYATDISKAQIENAVKRGNIFYSVQPAEKINFAENLFDLIIVGQAAHWFDFGQFYAEVRRTAKDNALLCITGYGNICVPPSIEPIIAHFYTSVIGPYWDLERKYIDESYQTIPFPFDEIPAPHIVNKLTWTIEHLEGYLNTWSAVKHYIDQNGINPVDGIMPDIRKNWGSNPEIEVQFPLIFRVGRVTKTR